LSHDPSELIHN